MTELRTSDIDTVDTEFDSGSDQTKEVCKTIYEKIFKATLDQTGSKLCFESSERQIRPGLLQRWAARLE